MHYVLAPPMIVGVCVWSMGVVLWQPFYYLKVGEVHCYNDMCNTARTLISPLSSS